MTMTPDIEQRLLAIAEREHYGLLSEHMHALRLGAEEALRWLPMESAPMNRLVLLHYANACGKTRTITAVNAAKFTIESSEEYFDGDHCEESDLYYLPAGWYEHSDNNEDCQYASLDNRVELIGWMPMPPQKGAAQ